MTDEKQQPVQPTARELRRELFSDELLDELFSRVDSGGVSLTGEGGFLPELVKAVLERGMDAELTSHLGYGRGDPGGNGSGNSRNGTTPKRLGTEVGDIGLDQPRDRNSTFASQLVPKGTRRLGGLEDMIISLYAGGVTKVMGHLPARLRRSLTWDQGKEMAGHLQITADTGTSVYFCEPHSPWQRGTSENTNGLLRNYLPKGTNLAVHSVERLVQVQDELNNRPRKTLGWKSPAAALAQLQSNYS